MGQLPLRLLVIAWTVGFQAYAQSSEPLRRRRKAQVDTKDARRFPEENNLNVDEKSVLHNEVRWAQEMFMSLEPGPPTSAPTVIDCSTGADRTQYLFDLLSPITPIGILSDTGTPQGQAFLWLDEVDVGSDPCTESLTTRQRYAVATLYYATQETSGSGWTRQQGWLSAANECEWQGIICGYGDGSVTELRLANNKLAGSLPPEIKVLSRLEVFQLDDNALVGSLPSELAQLIYLTELTIEDNSLTGEPLPMLVGLTNLRDLRTSLNLFEGTIPSIISSLDKLRVFWSAGNNLRGTIPTQLGQMTPLQSLIISRNQLSGTIPSELGNLNLFELLLGEQELGGTIPDEIFKNTNLRIFRLEDNNLQGTLSMLVGMLTQVRDFRISDNNFSGTLPVAFWALSNMISILVNDNNFEGPLRNAFGAWRNLDFIDFSDNEFTGLLPRSLFDLPNLRIAYFSNNNFQGQIPDNFAKPPLRDLYLDNNLLDGTIPSIDALQFRDLSEFLVHSNDITGTMPAAFCSLRTPEGILEDLWADCLEPNPEVACDCCTQCF